MAIPGLPGFHHLPEKPIYFPQKDTYACTGLMLPFLPQLQAQGLPSGAGGRWLPKPQAPLPASVSCFPRHQMPLEKGRPSETSPDLSNMIFWLPARYAAVGRLQGESRPHAHAWHLQKTAIPGALGASALLPVFKVRPLFLGVFLSIQVAPSW